MRRLKMKTFLAAAAVAALAIVVPASASAYTWTVQGEEGYVGLEGSETASEAYEGGFGFTVPGAGGVTCGATIEIEAEGPSGGKIVDFQLDPEACNSSGWFDGWGSYSGCQLVQQYSNLAEGWVIDVEASPPTITSTAPTGELIIHNKFSNCNDGFKNYERTYRFVKLNLQHTWDEEGGITDFILYGNATNGIGYVFGPFMPAYSPSHLGLS